MAIAKVVDRLGNTLIDLTGDDVTPNKVLSGTTFHDNSGNLKVGILKSPQSAYLDKSKYNFIDYDGYLIYSFTDEEIDDLTELPDPIFVHPQENITFQEWNWTLEGLKNWDRTRPDRPIVGANYITTDGYTYIYLDLPDGEKTMNIYFNTRNSTDEIDWGDGTINTLTQTSSHRYTSPGSYVIKIKSDWNTTFSLGSGSPSAGTAKQYIMHIRFGTISLDSSTGYCLSNIYNLKTISIPNPPAASDITYAYHIFDKCYHLKNIVIPKYITGNQSTEYFFNSNRDLETISLPKNFIQVGRNFCQGCYSLKNIVLPSSLTTITRESFYECFNLKNIVIPKNVSFSGTNNFTYDYFLTLDLSNINKVLSIAGSNTIQLPGNYQNVGQYSNEILVPNDLLSAYENDTNWSYYKGYFKGV